MKKEIATSRPLEGKSTVRNIADLPRYLEKYKRMKKNMSVTRGTLQAEVNFTDTGFKTRFFNWTSIRESTGTGMHLCSMVARDVKKFIANNPDFNYGKYPVSSSPQTTVINVDHILLAGKNKCDGGYAFDIVSCYWNFALHLGFITRKTYLAGLQSPDWKIGRNMAIGALSKTSMVEEYTNGMFVGRKQVVKDIKLRQINAWIKWSVHDMFVELFTLLGGEFFMLFTDCIYVERKFQTIVKEFFAVRGLEVVEKYFFLDGIIDGFVQWQYAGDGSSSVTRTAISKYVRWEPNGSVKGAPK